MGLQVNGLSLVSIREDQVSLLKEGGTLAMLQAGTIDMLSAGTVHISGGTVVVGTISMLQAGTLDILKAGTVNISGGTLGLLQAGTLDMLKAGTVNISGGTVVVGTISMVQAGTLDILKAGTLDLLKAGTLDLLKAGTLDLLKAGTVTIGAGSYAPTNWADAQAVDPAGTFTSATTQVAVYSRKTISLQMDQNGTVNVYISPLGAGSLYSGVYYSGTFAANSLVTIGFEDDVDYVNITVINAGGGTAALDAWLGLSSI